MPPLLRFDDFSRLFNARAGTFSSAGKQKLNLLSGYLPRTILCACAAADLPATPCTSWGACTRSMLSVQISGVGKCIGSFECYIVRVNV